MDEAASVLQRLERIRELDRRRAPAAELVGELRALVGDAEQWAKVEGDARARWAALDFADSVQAGSAREPEEVRP